MQKGFWLSLIGFIFASLLVACGSASTPTAVPSPTPTRIQGTITAGAETPQVQNTLAPITATANSPTSTPPRPPTVAVTPTSTPISQSATVAEVNGEKISFAQYTDYFKLAVWIEIYNLRLEATKNPAPGQQQREENLLNFIKNAASLPVDRQVLQEMLTTLVLLKAAKDEGYSVDNTEIEREINNRFGTAVAAEFTGAELAATATASTLQVTAIAQERITILAITPLPGISPLPPTSTPAPPIPTPLTPKPTITPIPSPLATIAALRNVFFTEMRNLTNLDQTYFSRYQIEPVLLERKINAKLNANLPKIGEVRPQFRLSHILVQDEATVKELDQQIRAVAPNAQVAQFIKLAREKSLDLVSALKNGDLGWGVAESFSPNLVKTAQSLTVGQISSPVQTEFGWHLIYLTGKEDRPVDAITSYYLLNASNGRSVAFNSWFEQKLQAANAKFTN
jgi:parvulin-like peptidyl-prolyl isomerase